MSLVALSIDALLPALSPIGTSIHVTDNQDLQLLITMIFLGLGVGQLISGPISDSVGRKPVIYVGFIVFVLASILCVYSESLEWMIVGRIFQGVGLSAPRTLSIAMVRDTFSGNYMAKIMSFVVVIFILVPVVAPSIGKLLLDQYGWQAIFYSQLFFGAFVILWLAKRQPETLKEEYKTPLRLQLFTNGLREFFKQRQAWVFTLVSGLITGAFMVYLSASQQIFENQYQLKEEFPFIFAGLAISVGLATFLNGTLVMKYGMYRLVRFFAILFIAVSGAYIALFYQTPNPSIYVLVTFFVLQFFAIGFLFGNLRSLAMQPIGHIAGVGAAYNGFISTIMAVPIATFIGGFVKETSLPLFIGFFCCGILALGLILYGKTNDTNKN